MQHSLDLTLDNHRLPARYPYTHQYHQLHLSIRASHNTDHHLHHRVRHLDHIQLSIYFALTRHPNQSPLSSSFSIAR